MYSVLQREGGLGSGECTARLTIEGHPTRHVLLLQLQGVTGCLSVARGSDGVVSVKKDFVAFEVALDCFLLLRGELQVLSARGAGCPRMLRK